MSATSATRSRSRGSNSAAPLLTVIVVALVLGLAAVVWLTRPDTGDLRRTGELNAMGMPVVEVPGQATGTATAGAVEVVGAKWAMGTVPLNVSVQPSWILRNTGRTPVELGEPHAEVLEGCCPGPFSLGATTLEPGDTTTLTFDLSMHEGMDGWHDLAVHVPVADDVLTLGVTGDFQG